MLKDKWFILGFITIVVLQIAACGFLGWVLYLFVKALLKYLGS